jgi:hypothetical protein
MLGIIIGLKLLLIDGVFNLLPDKAVRQIGLSLSR